jgi:hypothetical protein
LADEIPAFTWPVQKALTTLRDKLSIHFFFGQWRIGPEDETAIFVPTILFTTLNISWQQVRPSATYVSFCFEFFRIYNFWIVKINFLLFNFVPQKNLIIFLP